LVGVDADDHEVIPRIFTYELIEPRKRFPAWTAPGGPEIDIDDFATVGAQVAGATELVASLS
jgi:hypothetical protein